MRCENCGHIMQQREGKMWCKSCRAEGGQEEGALNLESEEQKKEEGARRRGARGVTTPFPGITEKDLAPGI